ncbi:MAG: alpha/beta family hydrolase, partial [Pseudomonadota bacterium]
TGVEFYRTVNYDMFMFDYRGSGKTTGDIDGEAQLHADVRAAWDVIAPQYEGKPIVLYGRSLGAAFATRLATEVDPDLLVLVSPFESMVTMAQSRYPFVPEQILRYPFRNDAHIAEVSTPILLVHGNRDRFIPISHSEALLERAESPAELLVIEGAGHGDIHRYPSYLNGLAAALPN